MNELVQIIGKEVAAKLRSIGRVAEAKKRFNHKQFNGEVDICIYFDIRTIEQKQQNRRFIRTTNLHFSLHMHGVILDVTESNRVIFGSRQTDYKRKCFDLSHNTSFDDIFEYINKTATSVEEYVRSILNRRNEASATNIYDF